MSLEQGRRLGVYEITSSLGVGGMGEVYRARDTKLDREVAIKILPEDIAGRPERLARFEREAKLLAALDHPHIAAIHGFSEHDGIHFLAMELVSGQPLDEHLKRSALPVPEALEIASQIAQALEAAHAKGIIHRDLKPSNVMLTTEGRVKLLDFGLGKALAVETLESSLQTVTTPDATTEGVVMGTAPYMSPEQARGEEVDARTDVWAFGCVFFEILTGRRTFPGPTRSDAIATVLTREPEWDLLPPAAAASVGSLLRRCLKKDRNRRLRDIGDARIEIEDAASTPAAELRPAGAGGSGRLSWTAIGAALGVFVGLGLAFVGGWPGGESPEARNPEPPRRYEIDPRPATWTGTFDLSRDGQKLVYSGMAPGKPPQLYLRRLDKLRGEPIPGTEGAREPFLSADGEHVGFLQNGALMRVALDGGQPVELVASIQRVRGGSWTAEGSIVYAPRSLWRISADGAGNEELTKTEEWGDNHRYPQVLPGGSAVLYTVWNQSGRQDDTSIAVLSLDTRESKTLVEGASFGRYVATGHLVFARYGALQAVPFDLDRLETTGDAVRVEEGVRMNSFGDQRAHFEISDAGTLVFRHDSMELLEDRRLVWVDRGGNVEPAAPKRGPYGWPRLSPDGTRVALSVNRPKGEDIWLLDLARQSWTRLTFERDNMNPVWSPDGKSLAFASNRDGAGAMFTVATDGSGGIEPLPVTKGGWDAPHSWSRDGRHLAFDSQKPTTMKDVSVLALGEDSASPVATSEFWEDFPAFSPDGWWLAYGSTESGPREIYVRPFPSLTGKWTVSTDGGYYPRWSPKGDELFYRRGSGLMAVPIETRDGFKAGTPRLLFELESWGDRETPATMGFDVSADAERFLVVERPDPERSPVGVVVVPRWFDVLRAKLESSTN